MTKKVCVLFALLLVVIFASPAMAATFTATWIGGTTGAATTWSNSGNWTGAGGSFPYHYYSSGYDTVLINNSSTTNTLNSDLSPQVGLITDSYTGNGGVFTITGKPATAAATVAAGCTLNLAIGGDSYSTTNGDPSNAYTFTVNGPTALLNITGGPNNCGVNVLGGGTVTWNTPTAMNSAVSITGGSTFDTSAQSGKFIFAGLTGDSSETLKVASSLFATSGFNFAGQINYTSTVNTIGFDTSAAAVVGANINLAGSTQTYYCLLAGYSSTNKTFTDSKLTGDGRIDATSDTYGTGNTSYIMVSNGTTFTPSPTNVVGGVNTNGQMTLYGSLQLNKDTSGTLSTIVAGVLSNGGTDGGVFTLGTDYTQFTVKKGGASSGGFVTCTDSANPLADTNLVVNITKDLSKATGTATGVHSMTDLGTVGVDPFANQTLTVFTAASTGFSGAFFANCPVSGQRYVFANGFATVNYTPTGVTLTNIFSNPSLAGDIDNSGTVDSADYNVWAANDGDTGATWLQGDLDGSGTVDSADYNIWAAADGNTTGTPEPISMIILAIGGGLVALKRRNAA